MILRTRFAPFLVMGALSAGLAALVAPPAKSDTGCAGYAEPLNRAEAFWTRARAEQVRSCAAQRGAGPGGNRQRVTPLHLAALFSGDPAAVAPLLEGGADPNASSEEGFTPLHAAAQSGRSAAIVAILLKAGANPDARNKKGVAPLHLGAKNNRTAAIVATLLEGGADPNARNKQGATALHFAAKRGSRPMIVGALLNGGADPNAGTGTGFVPLHFAVQFNRTPAIVAMLLKDGADPNAKTRKGATPLHLAALKNSNPAVAAALLKAGADPNAKATNGATPLHLAALKNSNPAVVAALLKAGADPKIAVKGKTAFDLGRNNKKLAGSAAYLQLKEAHDKSKAARQAARQKATAKSQTPDADDAAREPVSWRGACSVGKELKPGEGCRIPGGGEFKVASDGCVRSIPDIPRGSSKEKVKMSMGGFSVSVRNGKSSTCIRGHLRLGKFAARRQAETSSWKIEASP